MATESTEEHRKITRHELDFRVFPWIPWQKYLWACRSDIRHYRVDGVPSLLMATIVLLYPGLIFLMLE